MVSRHVPYPCKKMATALVVRSPTKSPVKAKAFKEVIFPKVFPALSLMTTNSDTDTEKTSLVHLKYHFIVPAASENKFKVFVKEHFDEKESSEFVERFMDDESFSNVKRSEWIKQVGEFNEEGTFIPQRCSHKSTSVLNGTQYANALTYSENDVIDDDIEKKVPL